MKHILLGLLSLTLYDVTTKMYNKNIFHRLLSLYAMYIIRIYNVT